MIAQPGLPELQEDCPFLWYEHEYVIPMAPPFVCVAKADDALKS